MIENLRFAAKPNNLVLGLRDSLGQEQQQMAHQTRQMERLLEVDSELPGIVQLPYSFKMSGDIRRRDPLVGGPSPVEPGNPGLFRVSGPCNKPVEFFFEIDRQFAG